MSEHQFFEVIRYEGLHIIRPSREIRDQVAVIKFSDELLEFVDREQPKKVQFTFEDVDFFSTEGINALIRTQSRVRKWGGRMNVCGLSQQLRSIFELFSMQKVFAIYDSCSEATAALRKDPTGDE